MSDVYEPGAGKLECPACFSMGMKIFHENRDVPVNSVLNIPTMDQALSFARGDIALGFCPSCGFISNLSFDPAMIEYSTKCEESQGYSDTYNSFLRDISEHLVKRYDLHKKTILEIGCGKGEFISLLCRLGNNRGIAFDPAFVEERIPEDIKKSITFITDFYSEKYAGYEADFVCCKMTLEHIPDPGVFLGQVRKSIAARTDTIVFFQVPDATRIMEDASFEDIYYEHCSYFSPGSIARLFRKCGFDVLDLYRTYGGQYIMIEAKPCCGHVGAHDLSMENDLEQIAGYVDLFGERLSAKIRYWRETLGVLGKKNGRVILWGSGSKGVSFLTTLKISREVEYVVDINPYRQGTFMAGTGQKIVSPQFLNRYRPGAVIVMNPIYRNEVQTELNCMGLYPEVLTLGDMT